VAEILAACAEGVRVAAVLLSPIMPAKCNEVLAAYGSGVDTAGGMIEAARWGRLAAGTKIAKCAPFMRVDAPTA
jgi:methionyl-tRNA synthetase